jgi:hypothetical protein
MGYIKGAVAATEDLRDVELFEYKLSVKLEGVSRLNK